VNGVDIFLYVGAGAGLGVLIGNAVSLIRRRALSADLLKAEQLADAAIDCVVSQGLRDRLVDGPSLAERFAQQSSKMDVEDLALMSRYAFGSGVGDLIAPRRDEVRAWEAKRRRQPMRRLAAVIRSAAVG